MKKGLLIVGIIVVLIGGFLIGSYNGLASSREQVPRQILIRCCSAGQI